MKTQNIILIVLGIAMSAPLCAFFGWHPLHDDYYYGHPWRHGYWRDGYYYDGPRYVEQPVVVQQPVQTQPVVVQQPVQSQPVYVQQPVQVQPVYTQQPTQEATTQQERMVRQTPVRTTK